MRSAKRIRVLVVDGDALTRLGILAHLRLSPKRWVCTEADSAPRARQLCAAWSPDVIVIDLPIPHGDGFGLVRELARLAPKVRILVIGTQELDVERLFRAGAHGILHRHDAPAALGEAIATILCGERFLSHRAGQAHFAVLARKSSRTRAGLASRGSRVGDAVALSDRELTIFAMTGGGEGPSRIACDLGISVKTVETHQRRLKEKLDVRSAADLRQRAKRWLAAQREA